MMKMKKKKKTSDVTTLEVVWISRPIQIFLPSDDSDASVMDVILRLIRLIVGAVDTITGSGTLESEQGEEINQSCPSRTT